MAAAAPVKESIRDLQSLRIPEGKRKPDAKRPWWLLAVVALIAVLASARPIAHSAFQSKPSVETLTIPGAQEQDGHTASLNASGYVTPRLRATIASKTTGRLSGVYVDEGTVVTQGQILPGSTIPICSTHSPSPKKIAILLSPPSRTTRYSCDRLISCCVAPRSLSTPAYLPSRT